jgi:hypothetical protein
MTSYIHLSSEASFASLGPASPVPDNIFQAVSSDRTHSGLTTYLPYFSLGDFMVDVDLLEPHPTQRKIDSLHLDTLLKSFENTGAQRVENYGVAIGLGEGWNNLKKLEGKLLRITSATPNLENLRITPGGPIAQVIRGGHRTAAIKHFSTLPDMSDEGYWCYTILIPSKSFFILLLSSL